MTPPTCSALLFRCGNTGSEGHRMTHPMLEVRDLVAALTQIACVAADSDVSSSPTKKRQFCDAVAKRLFDLISEMKHDPAEGRSRVIVFGEPPHSGPSN
jgi:hypothetical protein